MLELDGFIGLLLLAFWVYCLFDVITSLPEEIRNLPKPLWLLIVLLTTVIGAGLWLLAGRPRRSRRQAHPSGPGTAPRRRPPRAGRYLAPDDDPDFLRQLGRDMRHRNDEDLGDGEDGKSQ